MVRLEEHLSCPEIAARLGVSERLIRSAVADGSRHRDPSGRRGIWPIVRIGRKCVRVPASAAQRWLEARHG